jgi:putative ABC transport system permease protein
VNLLLLRATARHLIHHPWQLGLALLGIALGVAVVCAVQLTQASARQALQYAQRSLVGPSTHRIEAAEGTLDEQAFAALAQQWPQLSFMPGVSGDVMLADAPSQRLQVIGVDPLTASGTADARLGPGFDLLRFLDTPGAALLNADTAARLGVVHEARLRVRGDEGPVEVTIVGIAPAARDGGPADDMLVLDIASAQELLGMAGRLSAIEVALPAGLRAAELRASLPVGWRLVSNATRLGAAREMTRAFDVNLTALSLLALLVGMFLIYNTSSFLVLQRQPLFARLRALGVSRRELLVALLSEAAVLGLLGCLAGLAIGRGIAGLLLAHVARTINDLHYRAAITEVATSPALLAGIAGLGLAATLAAALPPMLAATRVSVMRVARPGPGIMRTPVHGALLVRLAGAAWAVAALLLALPTRALVPGFAALFACLLGAACLVPWLLTRSARALARRPALAPTTLLALRALSMHGQRAGLAAAALMVACATGIAITVMVASFRVSVADWLSTLLRADVYVSLTTRAHDDSRRLATFRRHIDTLPEVAATSAVVRTTARTAAGPISLLAYDLPAAARPGFRFIAGEAAAVWAAWDEDTVMITEPYAWRHGLAPGDSVAIDTAAGPVAFRISAVYRDYASERGSVAMSHRTYLRHFPPRDDAGLGVYAAPGVGAARLEQALRAAMGPAADVRLQSNASLRALSLAVFDQTFAVTDLLRLLALGVAFVGIVSALLAQQMERLTDYALMRALGFRRDELLRVVLSQTLATGAVAATLAVPVGLVLAVLLIDVINVRSFGWTMNMHVPWARVLTAWASAIAAALLAAALPAWRAVHQAPASILRND